MSTPPAEYMLQALASAASDLAVVVEITTATATYRVADRIVITPTAGGGISTGIQSIATIAVALDPITRAIKADQIDIEVADEWARPLIASVRLRGKGVKILIGEAKLSWSLTNFLTVFSGTIEEITPLENRAGIVFGCRSILARLDDIELSDSYHDQHPLEVALDILSKVVPSALINTSTFDPSLGAYFDIGHYVVSRSVTDTMLEDRDMQPVTAKVLLDALMSVLNGTIRVANDGRVEFVIFNATPIDTWDDTDIIRFRQDGDGDVINRVSCRVSAVPVIALSHRSGMTAEKQVKTRAPDAIYTVDETVSQAAYSYVGASNGVYEHEIDVVWQTNNNGFLETDISSVDTTILVRGLGRVCCGTHWPGYPSAQPSWATISVVRPLYLMIEDEIVKCTTPPTAFEDSFTRFFNSLSKTETPILTPNGMQFTGVARGQLNTTPAPHKATDTLVSKNPYPVRDVTMAVAIADYMLGRFAFGAPKISVTTNISKCWLAPGDIVAIEHADYIAFGKSGLTTSTPWEIVSREIDVAGRVVHWELVSAEVGSLTKAISAREAYFASQAKQAVRSVLDDLGFQARLQSAVAVTHVAGRTVQIAPSTVTASTYRVGWLVAANKTLTATKDTYIYHDVLRGGYVFRAVAVGAAAPSRRKAEALIAKVTTNATTVTAIDTSGQVTTALSGAKLDAYTVRNTEVANESLTVYNIDPRQQTDAINPNPDLSAAHRGTGYIPDGWRENAVPGGIGTLWGAYFFSRSGGKSGGRYVELNRAGTQVVHFEGGSFPVSVETLYEAEFTIRASDATSPFIIALKMYDESKAFIGYYTLFSGAAPSAGAWLSLKKANYFVDAFSASARFASIDMSFNGASVAAGYRLDVDKLVVTRAQQAFRAYATAPQSVPASAVTVVNVSGALYDKTPIAIGGTNYGFHGASNRYTVLQDGQYQFSGRAKVFGVSATAAMECGLLVNGAIVTSGSGGLGIGPGLGSVATVSDAHNLAKGDYVQLYCWHNDAAARNTVVGSAETYLSGFRKKD